MGENSNSAPQSKPLRLRCSSCGATTDAACECGAAYVPAGKLAEKAVKANPEKSDRAIAAELGVDDKTVRHARAEAGAEYSAPRGRVGRDGKTYPSSKPSPGPGPRIDLSALQTDYSARERELSRELSEALQKALALACGLPPVTDPRTETERAIAALQDLAQQLVIADFKPSEIGLVRLPRDAGELNIRQVLNALEGDDE